MRAESSTPTQQIQVMTMIQATPTARIAHLLAAAASQPKSWNEYWPATKARLGMTSTSATMIAQPAVQPLFGPIALLTHVKVVPQSGSARLR